jgi:outer membrane protein TolC
MAAITLRWNVFNGYADRARADEAAQALTQAKALERQTSQAAKLQVRRASANLDAATERVVVTESAVSEAEESLRIIKNRYEAGLTTITELLRGETALLDAKSRQLAAFYEQRAAGVALELAAGTLSPDSAVLQ